MAPRDLGSNPGYRPHDDVARDAPWQIADEDFEEEEPNEDIDGEEEESIEGSENEEFNESSDYEDLEDALIANNWDRDIRKLVERFLDYALAIIPGSESWLTTTFMRNQNVSTSAMQEIFSLKAEIHIALAWYPFPIAWEWFLATTTQEPHDNDPPTCLNLAERAATSAGHAGLCALNAALGVRSSLSLHPLPRTWCQEAPLPTFSLEKTEGFVALAAIMAALAVHFTKIAVETSFAALCPAFAPGKGWSDDDIRDNVEVSELAAAIAIDASALSCYARDTLFQTLCHFPSSSSSIVLLPFYLHVKNLQEFVSVL